MSQFKSLKRRCGISLTEVVVGLALLGTLLTMLVVASGRLQIQRKAALDKLQAVNALDSLMSQFFSSGFPDLGSSGPIPSNPDWVWTVRKKDSQTPAGTCIVRVSIRASRQVDQGNA